MIKICTKCKTEKDTNEFGKHKARPDGLQCWCKECNNSSLRNNRSKIKNKKKSIKRVEKKCSTCKTIKSVNDFPYKSVSIDGFGYECKICVCLQYKKWRLLYPDKQNAKTNKRHVAKLKRTVAWANLDKILEFYTEAQRLTKETGIQYHVDHTVPLQGKNVSGLHVENNIQVITATENLTKHNKF